jgi:hypothetical protein
MNDPTVEHVAKTAPDVVAERVERLQALLPECVAEGKVDFDRLRVAAFRGDRGGLWGCDECGGAAGEVVVTWKSAWAHMVWGLLPSLVRSPRFALDTHVKQCYAVSDLPIG